MNSPASSNTIDPRRRFTARNVLRTVLRWIEHGLAIFGGLVLIGWCTLDISVIVSPSMAPTLEGTNADNGDRVLTEKVSYWFRSPRRWEVITFIDPTGNKRMKRIAGLPGEGVQMLEKGELLIDGERVIPPGVIDHKYLRYGNLADGKIVPCGNGYYVLGDDLKDSDDSRFNDPVPTNRVIGRAWIIMWPMSRMGFIK